MPTAPGRVRAVDGDQMLVARAAGGVRLAAGNWGWGSLNRRPAGVSVVLIVIGMGLVMRLCGQASGVRLSCGVIVTLGLLISGVC